MKIAMIGISESDTENLNQNPNGNDFYLPEMNAAFSRIGSNSFIVPMGEESKAENFANIEYFLFPDFFRMPLSQLNMYKTLYQLKKERKIKLVYLMQEPESVIPQHGKSEYVLILKYFDYILTYNDELVDNNRVFKLPIPYNFSIPCPNLHIDFQDKKLLTNISGWHVSQGKHELYSEREKVIDYFEDAHSEEFDFYGIKWDRSGREYCNYRGRVDNKYEIYQKYKFALCLENTYGISGYITEKIMDCFKAGIVPIYKGASDVQKYIPDDAYIPYDKFRNIEELYQFLSTMSYETYEGYRNAITAFMNSEKTRYFTIEHWAEALLAACEQMEEGKRLFGIGSLQHWYNFHVKVYPRLCDCKRKMCGIFKLRKQK